MTAFSADAFEEIGAILAANRRREYFIRAHLCALKNNGKVVECWCHQAGPNGTNLPCPTDGQSTTAPTSAPPAADLYEGCGYGVSEADKVLHIMKAWNELKAKRLQSFGLPLPWSFP